MAKIVERHYIDEDNNFSVYRQANSKRWYARFKLGEWYSKGTGETDLQKAIVKAVQIQTECKIMLSNNIPIQPLRKVQKHLFKAIAELAIKRMEDAIENGTGKVIYTDYIGVLKKYHIVYFGQMHIRECVGLQTLMDFDTWRIAMLGRVPAKSTILTHNSAMQRVLDEAVIHRLLTASEIPELKNTGKMGKRRAAFDKDEYRLILEKAKNWIKDGRKQVTRDIRKRLYYYIQIAALTGMRIGTEMDNLTWEDVQFKEKEVDFESDGKIKKIKRSFLTFNVRKGKTTKYTGTRRIVAKKELRSVIEDMALNLRKGNKWKHTDKIFGNTKEFSTNFKNILDELDLKSNTRGERTLYSLRHSYITWALEKGTALRQIADQCGTSEQMIEQHYKHTNPMMFAEDLS